MSSTEILFESRKPTTSPQVVFLYPKRKNMEQRAEYKAPRKNSKHLLINEPPLQVLPSLAVAIGLDEAIVVQQLHYWLTNPKNEGRVDEEGNKWVYNTYDDWKEDNFPFWSADKIQRIFLDLEKTGIVIARQLDAKKRDMRKFYRLDYDQICMMDGADLRLSMTAKHHDVLNESETNTETTQIKGVDWKIAHGEKVTNEDLRPDQTDEVENTLVLLDQAFHTTFARTPKSQSVAKFIISRVKQGDSLDRFIAWAKRDEFNASRTYEYAEQPDKIRTRWAQAFVKDNAAPVKKEGESSGYYA
jgi:phytoene dehydrogenase-like protein